MLKHNHETQESVLHHIFSLPKKKNAGQKKKEEAEPKEMQGLGGMEGGGAAGVRGRATMRAQTSLFGMQIISEFLISINA